MDVSLLASTHALATTAPSALTSDLTAQYQDIAVKIAMGLGVGLLVGLEREWAQKEVGVRTAS